MGASRIGCWNCTLRGSALSLCTISPFMSRAGAADKGLMAEATFKPGDLQEAKLCYWRVDEVLAGGSGRIRVDDIRVTKP